MYLNPVKVPHVELAALEAEILDEFRKKIYSPLMALLPVQPKLSNEMSPKDTETLYRSMNAGKITYNRGKFSGKFDAATTRALKAMGAKWNRTSSTFDLSLAKIPDEAQQILRATASRFEEKIQQIDDSLRKILPEDFADAFQFQRSLDKTIFRMDNDFRENVRNIAVAPKLTAFQRQKISDEWQGNLRKYVKDFTVAQIKTLRADVKAAAFAGDRYGSLVKSIQRSYDVTANKARFLARQETRLMTTKFQEARYLEVKLPWYEWHDVGGTTLHPVRPWHHDLNLTTHRWDKPPITTDWQGKYGKPQPKRENNPGGDYNCRCFAIPIVRKAA